MTDPRLRLSTGLTTKLLIRFRTAHMSVKAGEEDAVFEEFLAEFGGGTWLALKDTRIHAQAQKPQF